MGFSVSFDPATPSEGAVAPAPARPSPGPGPGQSPEPDDDYETLVMEACDALSDAGGSTFHISGFGTDEWPLDVAYDMSTFIEQLPPLLAGVRERREVVVDLYSQGVERTLTFRPVGNLTVIRCESRTDWIPDPECESLEHGELVAMLSKLAHDFARGLKSINSELSEVDPFARWLKGGA